MSGCEDLDVYPNLMSEVVPFMGPFSERRFVLVNYSVSDEEFVIKVNYEKDKFEHLINDLCGIIKEAQKSKLHRYC